MSGSGILVVGSANIDLVVAAERLPQPGETLLGSAFATFAGGKGANQAVAASRAGGRVSFLGCVGDDEYGVRLRSGLEASGVDTRYLQTMPGPSGVALIVTGQGENMIVVAPGANALLEPDRIEPGMLAGVGVVLAQLETPLDTVLRAAEMARASGAMFVLDPAPARPLPPVLLRLVDWLTPNEGEARVLLGSGKRGFDRLDVARQLKAMGPRAVVLKLGAQGSMLLEEAGEPIWTPAAAADVVDTTAAGDAFNGAFAVALAEGLAATEAVYFATAAAAISVSRQGAQPSLGTRDEIDGKGRHAG